MKRHLPQLHAVTDNSVLELTNYTDLAGALAMGKDVAVHIRSGTLGGRRLTQLAADTRAACRPHKTLVFVNDRADVALAAKADGLHLPSAGLPVHAARRLLGDDVLIGRSTHSVDEALAAVDEGVDYVFLGPIWPTRSHPDRKPLGLGVLSAVKQIPVIAIGGIEPDLVPLAIDAGAYGVAAITCLWHAPDPHAVAESMLLSF
ncbi:MAG: thiamine phosphate synthase [Gemmatimonadota bacterium]|nr:MAG: thiamine phosphate synthase [Gemmatimonadota bacterium]